MKGLLYKELTNSRNLLLGGAGIMLLAAAVWASVDSIDQTQAAPAGGILLSGLLFWTLLIVSYFLFQRDEKSKWNLYALSLPVDKGLLVKSRYLFLLCILLAGSAIALCYSASFGALAENDLLWLHLNEIAQTLVFLGFFLPVAYKAGPQSAGFLLFMLLVLISLFSLAFAKNPDSFLWITVFLSALPKWISLAAAVLIFTGSYFLSCRALQSVDIK